jgi:CheY-like chemotaxis protein
MKVKEAMILLVEDNRDDVFFFRRAMSKAQLAFPVQVVEDGQEAIDYLSGIGRFRDRFRYPMPTVVLLDLKLPYVSGFEVLTWIREQPALAALSVVILTSSPEQRDRDKANQLGATGYLVKPPTEGMLRQLLGPTVPEQTCP